MDFIAEFWETPVGKFVIFASGGLAGLALFCVICTVCSGLYFTLSAPEVTTAETVNPERSEPRPTPRSAALPGSAPGQGEPNVAGEAAGPQAMGGLGLSQAEWEQAHVQSDLAYPPLGVGYDGIYDVIFQEGNVWYIERQWPVDDAVTPEMIEMESRNLIPPDSQLVQTYSPEGRPETVVNLYMSESLKSRFQTPELWSGGDDGQFIVLYELYDYGVTRMVINAGNNP
jgi:hypothetical protein